MPYLLILTTSIIITSAQYSFGQSPCHSFCNGPMCQSSVPCSLPPPRLSLPVPMCPPPPPCLPRMCPPPPVCPPPPPPIPCPIPITPRPCSFYNRLPPSMFYQLASLQPYQPSLQILKDCNKPSIQTPAQNDCCCGCSLPCKYRSVRRAAFAAKTIDPLCNNLKLKKIILNNISEDESESKRAIRVSVERDLGIDVNVICGKGEFSYIAQTDNFCQAIREKITCYAFKSL